MTCLLCNGDMESGTTTYVTDLGKCIVIIKNVPCMKCRQCGEVVYTGAVVTKLEEMVEAFRNSMTEIAVIDYSNKVA